MSNIPGFTAEASLSKTRAHYRTALSGSISGHSQLIAPQSFLGTIGGFFKDLGGLLWDGVKCMVATTKVGVECTGEIIETGNVAGCAAAISEWSDSCIKE